MTTQTATTQTVSHFQQGLDAHLRRRRFEANGWLHNARKEIADSPHCPVRQAQLQQAEANHRRVMGSAQLLASDF